MSDHFKKDLYDALENSTHQISGWSDEHHIKSSIGDRFPVSLNAPLNSNGLKKKLESLSFLGGGSGGVVFLDEKEKKVYKFISLKGGFVFKTKDWETNFINEIELAVESSINGIGPKIYWHSIYLNYYQKPYNEDNIDFALGVIVMEYFHGDLITLLQKIQPMSFKNILTMCFNQIQPQLIKQLKLLAPSHYLCHDIRGANILYQENTKKTGGGRRRKKTRRQRTRKKSRKRRTRKRTGGVRGQSGLQERSKKSISKSRQKTFTTREITQMTKPKYRFVLSDFDNSHCTSITPEEYQQWGNIIEILSLCRISIHFSAIISNIKEKSYNNYIEHFKTDKENIIGFREINNRFKKNKDELNNFFKSDTWLKICRDYWFHTPMLGVIHIDNSDNNWGSNEDESYTKIPNDLLSIYYPEYSTASDSLFSI